MSDVSDAIREALDAMKARLDAIDGLGDWGDEYDAVKAALQSQTAPAVSEGWKADVERAAILFRMMQKDDESKGLWEPAAVEEDMAERLEKLLDAAPQHDHIGDAGKVVQGEPVAWAVFADNGNLRIWGREKPKSFPDAFPLYLRPTVKDSLTAESLAQLDSEDQKGMERIVEAVAHIGIDFGHGTYELEQCHIDRAREIKESLARLRASQQEGGDDSEKN